jgi:hypothetical protein
MRYHISPVRMAIIRIIIIIIIIMIILLLIIKAEVCVDKKRSYIAVENIS